jgi:hypothetical protein
MKSGDSQQYFLNLSMIRDAALEANLPFLNIVQASSWDPAVRVPNANEMRYLVYTTVAYGAQGISYFIYCCPNIAGGIANADGTPTPLYHALKNYNPQFVAITNELRSIKPLGVYHTTMKEPGCQPLPSDMPFKLTETASDDTRGFLIGLFGTEENPTHVVVVNLDYTSEAAVTLVGSGRLDIFDATKEKWIKTKNSQSDLTFPPGGGTLVRLQK